MTPQGLSSGLQKALQRLGRLLGLRMDGHQQQARARCHLAPDTARHLARPVLQRAGHQPRGQFLRLRGRPLPGRGLPCAGDDGAGR
jgi:hypothetical protein